MQESGKACADSVADAEDEVGFSLTGVTHILIVGPMSHTRQ